jgi:hypothetical protein
MTADPLAELRARHRRSVDRDRLARKLDRSHRRLELRPQHYAVRDGQDLEPRFELTAQVIDTRLGRSRHDGEHDEKRHR